jgi:hypothetical protein
MEATLSYLLVGVLMLEENIGSFKTVGEKTGGMMDSSVFVLVPIFVELKNGSMVLLALLLLCLDVSQRMSRKSHPNLLLVHPLL